MLVAHSTEATESGQTLGHNTPTERSLHEGELSMEQKFQELIDDVKARSRTLRRNGRDCCANQLLSTATYLEGELEKLELKKKKG